MWERKTILVSVAGIAFTVATSCATAPGGQGAPSGAAGGDPDTGDQTGAAASIPDRPDASLTIQEYLRGQVSGLEIIPGRDGDFRLRIRGIDPSLIEGAPARQPLVIIDDVPLSEQAVSSALANLAPSDIDDVQVLKDVASTSIYGTRGAAGVILISTRKQN